MQEGRRCWVAGWGSEAEDSFIQSEILREISVATIGTKMCNSDKIYRGELHWKSMTCAGSLDGAVDACLGDSGPGDEPSIRVQNHWLVQFKLANHRNKMWNESESSIVICQFKQRTPSIF